MRNKPKDKLIPLPWLCKAVIVCALLAFFYAVTTMTLERVIWNYADEVSRGVLRAQSEVVRWKMRHFGQYVYHLEILLGATNKPVSKMTWEEYRSEHARKIALELKIARAIHGLVGSFLGAELREDE